MGRQQAPVQKAQAKPEILWKTEEILMSEIMLTTKCVAKRLNISHHTLKIWRTKGKGPRYLKEDPESPQSTVRYPEKWVEQWQKERMI